MPKVTGTRLSINPGTPSNNPVNERQEELYDPEEAG